MIRRVTWAQACERWPRLVRAMCWAAVLSKVEAGAALRDLAEYPRWGGGEAVVHFGGPLLVVQRAIACRRFVRNLKAMA